MAYPIKLGRNAKIYYKVGGQAGGGSWNELSNVGDVTVPSSWEKAEVRSRANLGYKTNVPGLRELTVTFDMPWKPTNAGFIAIKNAHLAGEVIGLRILDSEGGQGPQADWMVAEFTRNEPLGEAMTASVEVALADSDTPPSWVGG